MERIAANPHSLSWAGWVLLAVIALFAAPVVAGPSLEVKITNPHVWPQGCRSGCNCEVEHVIVNHTGKAIQYLFPVELYNGAGGKVGGFSIMRDDSLEDGETTIKYSAYIGRDVASCEAIASWRIPKFEKCKVRGVGDVDPQSCYRLLKATSGDTATAPLPSFPMPTQAADGKANPSKSGGDDSSPGRMSGNTAGGRIIPSGNYKCFSSMGSSKWGSWVLMGNIEIVSNNTFRIGDSRKYGYSYDSSTGGIKWSDGMHKGDNSSFHYTKKGEPEIVIKKKDWPRPTWYCKQE